MRHRTLHPLPAVRLGLCAGAVVSLMHGCSDGNGSKSERPPTQVISASEFAAPAPSTATPPPAPTPPPATITRSRDRFTPAPVPYTPHGDETIDAAALVGTPIVPPVSSVPNATAADAASAITGREIIYESLVGQINGRPVFASEVLEPLDGRLRASALRTDDARRWNTDARAAIGAQVKLLVDEELVLAEARQALSPEQQQGLLHFLGKIQESMVSQQGGSSVAADEAARAATGRTLTQTTRDKLDEVLIREEVRQRIGARLLVTWRQIQLEYERQFDKYNPKSLAKLHLVAVPTADAGGLARFKGRLAAGESFEAASEDPANALRGQQGLLEQPINGSLDKTTLVGIGPLNAAAQGLSVGGVAGPIEHEGAAWWVKLVSIEHPPGVTLYDAQLEIENSLLEKRKETELARYSNRLRARGNFSRIDDMVDRLMVIAADRYWASKEH